MVALIIKAHCKLQTEGLFGNMNGYLVKGIPTSIKSLLLFKVLFGFFKKNPATCYWKLVDGHRMKTEEKLYLCLKNTFLLS